MKDKCLYKKFLNTTDKKHNFVAFLMVLPGLIMFCTLVLYPLLWALRYVFYEYDGVTQAKFVGFDNFIRLFTREEHFWKSIGFTFKFVITKLVIEFPIAVFLGTLLSSKLLKSRIFFRSIYYTPVILSTSVMSVVFSLIFSPYNGLLNSVLMDIGLISKEIDWLSTPQTAFWCCVFLTVWQGFGQNTVLVMSGLTNISNDVYESASIDGAGKITQFFKITMPLLAPVLKTILMLMFIGALGSYESVFVLTGGGPNHETEVMSLTVYNQFFKADGISNYGYGATMGLMVAVIIGVITAIYRMLTRKMDNLTE